MTFQNFFNSAGNTCVLFSFCSMCTPRWRDAACKAQAAILRDRHFSEAFLTRSKAWLKSCMCCFAMWEGSLRPSQFLGGPSVPRRRRASTLLVCVGVQIRISKWKSEASPGVERRLACASGPEVRKTWIFGHLQETAGSGASRQKTRDVVADYAKVWALNLMQMKMMCLGFPHW